MIILKCNNFVNKKTANLLTFENEMPIILEQIVVPGMTAKMAKLYFNEMCDNFLKKKSQTTDRPMSK